MGPAGRGDATLLLMLQGLTELQKKLQQAKAALAALTEELTTSLNRMWLYFIVFVVITFALLCVPALLNSRFLVLIEGFFGGMILPKYEEYRAAATKFEDARAVVASIEQAIIFEEKRLQDAGSDM